jgi:hypothetical protein
VAVKSNTKKPAEAQTSDVARSDITGGGVAAGDVARGSAPAAAAASSKSEDVALVYGVSDDGQGLDIIRKREGRIEAGTVRALEHGKPIHGEVVRLKPRKNSPLVCDVEVDVPAPAPAQAVTRSTSQGPAQVATDQYRKNWDAIYKSRSSKSDKLLN